MGTLTKVNIINVRNGHQYGIQTMSHIPEAGDEIIFDNDLHLVVRLRAWVFNDTSQYVVSLGVSEVKDNDKA
jgi:hypothetical protein